MTITDTSAEALPQHQIGLPVEMEQKIRISENV
jgi:hypothetical protein